MSGLGRTRSCGLLIIIGSRDVGVKELLAVGNGSRESTESWAAVFRDLKRRGLNEPSLVVDEGGPPRMGRIEGRVPRRG